jgi:hypothetical protein
MFFRDKRHEKIKAEFQRTVDFYTEEVIRIWDEKDFTNYIFPISLTLEIISLARWCGIKIDTSKFDKHLDENSDVEEYLKTIQEE